MTKQAKVITLIIVCIVGLPFVAMFLIFSGLITKFVGNPELDGVWNVVPSSDGKTVHYFEGTAKRYKSYAIDFASGYVSESPHLTTCKGNPSCSPDGTWKLDSREKGSHGTLIVRVDMVSGKEDTIVDSGFLDINPIISHDAKNFAFARLKAHNAGGFVGETAGHGDIWVGKIGSTVARKATNLQAFGISPDLFLPDNRHILLSTDANDENLQMNIWLLDISDGTLKSLTQSGADNRNPILSPNGSLIVFESSRTEEFKDELWSMKPDGSNQRQITHLSCRISNPIFMPNGKSVLFQIGNQIWIIDVDGSNLKKLYPS